MGFSNLIGEECDRLWDFLSLLGGVRSTLFRHTNLDFRQKGGICEDRKAIVTKLRMADFQCRVEHSLDSKINFPKISHEEVVKHLNRSIISLTAL